MTTMDNLVKGTILAKMVKTLRKNKEKAREVLPPELHKYLSQKVLASSWYPVEDYVALLRAVAKILPDPGMDVFEYMGRVSLKIDFEGVYQPMVRDKDALGCLNAFVNMQKLTSKTVTLKVTHGAPGSATVERVHFGAPFIEETCKSQTGQIWQALTYGGGSHVKTKHVLCKHRGDDRCVWEARWSANEAPVASPASGTMRAVGG